MRCLIKVVCKDVGQLVRAWWQIDRPRAPAREGRLLRITPPAFLVIGLHKLEVIARTGDRSHRAPKVVYCCRDGDEDSQLIVTQHGLSGRLEIVWSHRSADTELDEAEIEVFAFEPAGSGSCTDPSPVLR